MKTITLSLYLKKYTELFGLSQRQAGTILEAGKTRFIGRGEKLFYDDSVAGMYFVLKGKLKLMFTTDPDAWIFKDILRPGDFFGDITLSNKKPEDEYAEGLSANSIICCLNTTMIRQMVRENPSMALNFAAVLGQKLRWVQKRHVNFINKDTKRRLIDFYKVWAEQEGERQGDKFVMENDMTLADIAEYISTSRQTVYTILKEFRKAGLFQSSRNRIRLCPSLWEKATGN